MQIGFFDSGVGGLTVLARALREISGADYLYYADTRFVPYGTKTKDEVRARALAAADSLFRHGAEVLVVACNTATSAAIETLRDKYGAPIIGMEPAVKPAVECHKDKRILVTATELSLREEKFRNLVARLDCEEFIDLLPLGGLVPLAEALRFDKESVEPYLREQFKPFDFGRYQAIVLGCTHFIFFKKHIQSIVGPEVDLIDGNLGTVRRLAAAITERGLQADGSGRITFFESGEPVTEPDKLERFHRLIKAADEACE
jgi:glutamate racemase